MRTPIHPGDILADEVEAIGMNASQFAGVIHVPANRVTLILKKQRGITADTALRLERALGTSAAFWLNLQKTYELDLVRQEHGAEIAAIKPLEKVA